MRTNKFKTPRIGNGYFSNVNFCKIILSLVLILSITMLWVKGDGAYASTNKYYYYKYKVNEVWNKDSSGSVESKKIYKNTYTTYSIPPIYNLHLNSYVNDDGSIDLVSYKIYLDKVIDGGSSEKYYSYLFNRANGHAFKGGELWTNYPGPNSSYDWGNRYHQYFSGPITSISISGGRANTKYYLNKRHVLDSYTIYKHKEKGSRQGIVVGTASEYPQNGIHSDGYWYIRGESNISIASIASTTNNITVNCTATDPSGLSASPYRFSIGNMISDWKSIPSYTFSKLSPNKDYNIKVESKDVAGNIKSVTRKIYTKAEVPSITVNNPTSITLELTIEDNNSSNTVYQIVNTSNNNYISSSGEETTSPTWLIPQNKSITINGLAPLTTYTYKVKAKNEEGIETVFSSPVSGTTLNPPPKKVSEVTATATSNEITIYWNPVDNATSYEVEADGGEPIDNGTNLSYTHIQLLPNSEHNYRVRAKNGEVEGEWSEAITKSTLPLAPVIPTNINTLSTENTITLTWNAVGNAVSYDIELDGEVISNGNSTNYVHTGLLPNTTHSYRIRSINPAGKSEWSSEVTAKTITDSLPIPMNIVANSGKTSVEIRWNEIVGMEYQIEADGNIIDNGINCIYTHSVLTPDTEHTYRVRSHKAGSYSDWSSPIKVRTSKDIFTAPSNIRSSATDTSIMISWEGVTGADGYDVEADGVIVDNGLNTCFTHKGLMPNTSHIYRIRARQGDTTSDWSSAINIVNISTYALATPKNLRATATETKIVASWDMVTNADSYDIKINNGPIENITDTTYTISGLVPGTQKKIMVRAVNAKGTSAYTVPITVITKASSSDSPQNISALTAKNQITLMWEPIQGAVSYDIEGNGAVTSAISANSYTFAELQPNTTYTYKIRVNKADGMQGQWSKAVTVITMADAPDAPQNLTASSTLNSVRLSWDGAVGAVEYEVEAGGQILNAGASNNYLITGLTPNTEYTYKVRAKNPATIGNWSQPITIRTKSSIQNYNINGNIGEEKNLVLNAIDIRDFKNYTFTITYNPNEIEIVDIASQTARPDLSIGNIGGTDIEVIQNTPGTLQFKKKSTLPIGQSYSGIINSIRLKFKVDKEAVITYTIQ
ncbi:MAG: fibronectin type III domain-containing protein [Maledivibacter sp.]|jgi:chitodextrinase|nr:fibronectin type III domain-containing protein [Maledivibacter sp.]